MSHDSVGATTESSRPGRPGEDGTYEPDVSEDDHLLGVPWRSFVRVEALRGIALLALAVIVTLWPRRTDDVLAVLLGLALALYVLTTAAVVVRDRGRRQFTTLLSIGLAAGLSVALITRPGDSIVSTAQLTGGLLIVDGLVGLLPSSRRQTDLTGRVSRAVLSTVAGGLLLLFPGRMLVLGISLAAVALAAAGLIDILLPSSASPETDTDGRHRDRRTQPGAALVAWIRHRPDLAEDRVDLMDKLYYEGALAPTRFARFLALMSFAAVIASVGIVLESTAVVIGAMLIAPLMIPLMGTALAVPMGWPRRLRRSAGVALSGIVLAITIGALVGALAPRTVDVAGNAEIIARITPTVVDLVVAVAAGAAGAYALARRDVSDSLPGVAVAIALVPPLTVVGLCWQQGAWIEGNGALLLFITNGIAIVIAGGAMFLLVGAAPLSRLSVTQQRLQTVITSLVVLAVGVTVLLSLNAAERLTIPDCGDRYVSVMVVNQDHYINHILREPGVHELTVDTYDTPYVSLAVRLFVDPNDAADVAAVNALQDQFDIDAASDEPYSHPDYDEESLGATRSALLQLSEGLPDARHQFGARDDVDPVRHLIGTASGWGGLPEYEAFYTADTSPRAAAHHRITLRDVPVDAFWSLTVYNRDGYFEANEYDSYSCNSVTTKPDGDGSVTIDLDTEDRGYVNHLYVMEGWNYVLRFYRPRSALLDGSWQPPAPERVTD